MVESSLIPDWQPEPEGFASGTPFDPIAVAALADAASPTADLDGDGAFDTVTLSSPSALVVATDLDDDGSADRLTAIADDGEFGGVGVPSRTRRDTALAARGRRKPGPGVR